MLGRHASIRPLDRGIVVLLWGLAALCVGLSGRVQETRRGYDPGVRSTEGLRVMTWNIGRTDGRPVADDHIDHIAKTVRALDPDVVVLQELSDRRQFQQVVSVLGHTWSGRSVDQGDRRLAVVVQRGSMRARPLARDSARPGLLTHYKARGTPQVVVVGLHADAYSAEGRNAVIGAAVDQLVRVGSGTPRILAGDLNIDLDLDKRHDLFSDNTHLDVESYNYVTQHFFDVGVDRGSTAQPDRRLDYIFISPELGVRGGGPLRGQRLGAMDHDPFVADLVFMQ